MAAEDRISEAFARIEEELLDSLMRNMERHQAEETEEGFDWPQWQALQLSELSRYSQKNAHRNGPRFDRLNARIDQVIRDAYETGRADEEARLLEAVRNGWEAPRDREDGFFHAPSERLDALINATHNDMVRAEYAILRKAEDDYRETIMDAAIYGTSGAGTYAQAIDMATRDFVRKGVTGITYRNGSKHSISEYSRMAVRTATKRAALVAEGDMRREWGVHTVFINYREDACPDCMVWQGQVLVDDVYSGGTAEEARDGGWPLLSEAMAQGLFHPNCKDTSSTYFEGITELPKEPTRADIEKAEERESKENELSNAEARRREYERLHRFSMDEEDSEKYGRLEMEWYDRAAGIEQELAEQEASEPERIRVDLGAEAYVGLSDTSLGIIESTYDGCQDEDLKRAYKAFEDKFQQTGKASRGYWHPHKRRVFIDDAQIAGNKFNKPGEVWWHEFGHAIDYMGSGSGRFWDQLSDSFDGGSFTKALKEDWKKIEKEHKAGMLEKLRERFLSEGEGNVGYYRFMGYLSERDYQQWLDGKKSWKQLAAKLKIGVGEVRRDYARTINGIEWSAAFQDIVEGVTKGEVPTSYGHGKSYWNTRGQLETEAFAEMFASDMCNDVSAQLIHENFPEAYAVFRDMINVLGGHNG